MDSIGFYIDFRHHAGFSSRAFDEGSVGISGTDAAIIRLIDYLKKSGLQVYVFATGNVVFERVHLVAVTSPAAAIATAAAKGVTTVIFNISQKEVVTLLAEAAAAHAVSLIAWAHNPLDVAMRNLLHHAEAVKRVVFVSPYHYNGFRDHAVIHKAWMIPNGIPIEEYPARSQANFDKRLVCYVGSLTPSKGFHLLAAAWPLVRKQIPGAKLSVIGSGKLYGKEVEPGPLGVADKDYETLILQQLGTPPDGLEKLGVRFLGLQPRTEIAAILSHAAVGVINPSTSGSLECCSVASLEIQACGIPIIAGRAGGNLDTVADGKTGRLVSAQPASIAAAMIDLLENETLNESLGQKGRLFVEQHFSMETIGKRWLAYLQQLQRQQPNKPEPLNITLRNIKPWIKEVKRRIGIT